MKIIEVASVLQRKTHYNQSGQALLPPLKLRQKGLITATSGLSPLRDFHSIKFRPADIPVWLDASHERLLRAPRPLRLRLRCQREKRCRSKVRHKCRPYHRPGSLASGGQDCGRCPLRVQVPQTCFRLAHCLGRFAPCTQMGNEHIPEPVKFEPFPIFSLDYLVCSVAGDGLLKIRFQLALCGTDEAERYLVLGKYQVGEPGCNNDSITVLLSS